MIKGLRHAHLNRDISILYTVSGANPTIIKLYGLFSHKDLGTGDTDNIKIQKSMAKRLSNLTFEHKKAGQ